MFNLALTAALFLALAILPALAGAQTTRPRPSVGAIRWDAWSGGDVTAQVERSLAPAKYQHRLPWFAQVKGDGQVRIDGNRFEVMEREIAFAADAGLDYWAFLTYPEESSMSDGLKLYLKSKSRNRINFCLILHNTIGVSAEIWPAERARTVALLKEPGYQRVLDNRPLIFYFVQSKADDGERFKELRAAIKDAGLNPYYVFMGWNPAKDFQTQQPRGFEAISAYTMGGAMPTFAELAAGAEKRWQAAAENRIPSIPLVTTGWEKNPRIDNPVSWEIGHGYHKQKVFPSLPTPEELKAHLQNALAFAAAHPDLTPANSIIIYAWNEHDEGGWLSPTWTPTGKPDTTRLDVLASLLKH